MFGWMTELRWNQDQYDIDNPAYKLRTVPLGRGKEKSELPETELDEDPHDHLPADRANLEQSQHHAVCSCNAGLK